ncbi:MAG TPA: DUF4136 domain-containing protein [Steroidobacteraceae bacterium]|nr:DUF4136 domain-containing protein [Steroidobacteraceae bacterium]
MIKFKVLFIAAAAVLISACAASGPKVRTDRDPTANLSSYQTFGFYDQLLGDRARYSTIMSNRLRAATIQQLTKLGYRYDVRSPQLRVNFFLQVRDQAEVRSTPATGFRPVAWAGFPREIETVGYKTGTLRIDLVDVARSASVWQGVAEGRIPEESLRNPGPAVDEAVRSIFRQFPDTTRM